VREVRKETGVSGMEGRCRGECVGGRNRECLKRMVGEEAVRRWRGEG